MVLLGRSLRPAPLTLAHGGPEAEPAFSSEILTTLGFPEITLRQPQDGPMRRAIPGSGRTIPGVPEVGRERLFVR